LPGGWIPLQIKLSVGTWWELLPMVWGIHPDNKGGYKSPSLQSWVSPQEMLWESQAEIWDTEAV
jgi:hypothetical protein